MKTRTWAMVVGGVLAGALTLGGLATVRAQSTPNGHGSSMGGTMGGMMGGPGGMMGGMMGGAAAMMGNNHGMMDELGAIDLAAGTATTPADVQQALQPLLDQAGRGNLIVGQVTTSEQYYHAVAKDRDTGTDVLGLMVDRATGAVLAGDCEAMMGAGEGSMNEQHMS